MSHIQAGREQFLREMQQLGVDVSRETRDRLEALVSTLARWQKAINLVGRATMDDVWLRHVLDSAQLKGFARKAAFLGEAARRMTLEKPPKIVIGRIEAVAPAPADVVTARALAPLGQLLTWADRYRTAPAICLFHKGKGWQAEVTESMKDWEIPYQTFTSVTDLDAVILRIGPYRPSALRDRQPEGRRRQNHDGD